MRDDECDFFFPQKGFAFALRLKKKEAVSVRWDAGKFTESRATAVFEAGDEGARSFAAAML